MAIGIKVNNNTFEERLKRINIFEQKYLKKIDISCRPKITDNSAKYFLRSKSIKVIIVNICCGKLKISDRFITLIKDKIF